MLGRRCALSIALLASACTPPAPEAPPATFGGELGPRFTTVAPADESRPGIAEIVPQRVHREPPVRAISSDGRLLATRDRRALAIVEPESGLVRTSLVSDLGPEGEISSLGWSPRNDAVVTVGTADGATWRATAWDLRTGAGFEMPEPVVPRGAVVYGSPPLLVVAPAGESARIEAYRFGATEPTWWLGVGALDGAIDSLILSPDEHLLALATTAGEVRLVDLETPGGPAPVGGSLAWKKGPVEDAMAAVEAEAAAEAAAEAPRSVDHRAAPRLLALGRRGALALHPDGRLTMTDWTGTTDVDTGCLLSGSGEAPAWLWCSSGGLRVDAAVGEVVPTAEPAADEPVDGALLELLESGGEPRLTGVVASTDEVIARYAGGGMVRWTEAGIELVPGAPLPEISLPSDVRVPEGASVRAGHVVRCDESGMIVYDPRTGERLGKVTGPCEPEAIGPGDRFAAWQTPGGRVRASRIADGVSLTFVVLASADSDLWVAAVADDGAIWTPDPADLSSFAIALDDGDVLDRTLLHGDELAIRHCPSLLADFLAGRPLPSVPPLAGG